MRLSAIAWRSLTARPARTMLTVRGVALGVALVAGTMLAADAATRAVARAAEDLYGEADLRVRAFDDNGLSDADSVTSIQALSGGHYQRDTRRAPAHPLDRARARRAGLHPARRGVDPAGGRTRPADVAEGEALSPS